jgi:hypothetical protein
MNKFHCVCIIAVLLILPLIATAEQTHYGIYSNMTAPGGEPSGYEVFLLHDGRPGKCSDSVLFQVAEGWPQYPELLDCCACSPSHVEFVSQKWGRFVGTIENDALVGEFIEARHRVSLKRGQSFWQER